MQFCQSGSEVVCQVRQWFVQKIVIRKLKKVLNILVYGDVFLKFLFVETFLRRIKFALDPLERIFVKVGFE